MGVYTSSYTTKTYLVVKIPLKTQMISGWGALVSESDRDKPPYLRKVAKSLKLSHDTVLGDL
jgi:hypothetical protein